MCSFSVCSIGRCGKLGGGRDGRFVRRADGKAVPLRKPVPNYRTMNPKPFPGKFAGAVLGGCFSRKSRFGIFCPMFVADMSHAICAFYIIFVAVWLF